MPRSSRLAQRVTQLDVADAAGVHNTTVSLALRNQPCIPLETRERIHAIAERLGYRPDPALRALAAYRRNVSLDRRPQTLAYLTTSSTAQGWRDNPREMQIHAGATKMATELGYQLEHFWFNEPGLTPQRLNRMLFHRRISAVVLASQQGACGKCLELDWDSLAGVVIGVPVGAAPLPRVTHHAAGDVRQAVRRALAAGYQRPGLVVPAAWDEMSEQALSLGFTAEQLQLSPRQRVPAYLLSRREDPARKLSDGSIHGLRYWLENYRPDVLVGPFATIQPLLEQLGREIPQDVALVDPFCETYDGSVAGVIQNFERVGGLAIELVDAQLQRNTRPLSQFPTLTLVDGAWRDGASMPPALATASIAAFDTPFEYPRAIVPAASA
jgi:LacI family transcriptional regulator